MNIKKLLLASAFLIGVFGIGKSEASRYFTTQSTGVFVSSGGIAGTVLLLDWVAISTADGIAYVTFVDSSPASATIQESTGTNDLGGYLVSQYLFPPVLTSSTTGNNLATAAQPYFRDLRDATGEGLVIKNGLFIWIRGFTTGLLPVVTVGYSTKPILSRKK